VAGIAAGLDHGDVHSLASNVVDRDLSEPGADTAPLILGIDADDVDHAHAFVEGVQRDGDETDRPSVGDRHEDVALFAQAARPDRLGLVSAPVGVQAEEDLVGKRAGTIRSWARRGG
jgi:hypothetical protein